jgi:drug/metabolite transporter (DMT)-like permease
MHGGDGEIPRNRRRWVLPAALVVVGVLMMVIGSSRQGDDTSVVWLQLGSALTLVGPLNGAQRMLERESPSSPPTLRREVSTSG